MDTKFLKYYESNIASSAIFLACKILKKNKWKSHLLNFHSKSNDTSVKNCAKDLCILL